MNEPLRAGQPWLVTEVDSLTNATARFIMKLAKKHQRTEGAIATRVLRLLNSSDVAEEIKHIKLKATYDKEVLK